MTTGRGGHYRIEWDVSWNPKRCEMDCYNYIEQRYPDAVYGEWEPTPYLDNEDKPVVDGRHVAQKKNCYANKLDKKKDIVKCVIIRQGVMTRFGQVNWDSRPTKREEHVGVMDMEG